MLVELVPFEMIINHSVPHSQTSRHKQADDTIVNTITRDHGCVIHSDWLQAVLSVAHGCVFCYLIGFCFSWDIKYKVYFVFHSYINYILRPRLMLFFLGGKPLGKIALNSDAKYNWYSYEKQNKIYYVHVFFRIWLHRIVS